MSTDGVRIALSDEHIKQASAHPSAHQDDRTGGEATKRRVTQFKKSHALNGALFFALWCVISDSEGIQ